MTEQNEQPEQPPDESVAATVEPPALEARRRAVLPWLTGAGFLILAAGLVWVWQNPAIPRAATGQTDLLAQRLDALDTRVANWEQRPPPAIPELASLTARVTALEQRPVPQQAALAPPAPDLGPLEARVSALEKRQPPSLAPLEARIGALEAKQPADAQLAARISALETAEAAMQARLAASDRADRRMSLVQSAGLALATGQKLGDLPGAPAALARFANTSPPTEAALRLAFPAAAREALAAARPIAEGRPVLARLWAQAQDLVTVRRGDQVLVGDPTAGVLERARAALDAGDLAAAVTEVTALQGAAAQAMTAWLTQARALLEARAALVSWGASG